MGAVADPDGARPGSGADGARGDHQHRRRRRRRLGAIRKRAGFRCSPARACPPANAARLRCESGGTASGSGFAEADGKPNLIVGDESCWQFNAGAEVPIQSPAAAVRYLFGGTGLLFRRDANDFAGDDFTRPAGPVTATTFLGRSAWTVEVAPPPHKPYPLRLTIDAETGLILQKRNDGFGLVEEWTEFRVGEPLPAELFSWDGPTTSAAQLRAAQLAEHEADGRRRSEWFAANVAPLPLRLELACGVWVHEYEPETGAFQASLGGRHVGMLARRPASEQGSWQLGWSDPGHRWRDERWEWALNLYDDDLTEEGLAALQRQLGSG